MILKYGPNQKVWLPLAAFRVCNAATCKWFCDLIPGAPHKCRSACGFLLSWKSLRWLA